MSTTIHSMNYRLLMDHRDFSEGQVLSRSELRKSKKMMEASRTPAERLEAEYKQLGKMAQAGAIDERAFNKEIALSKKRFDEASESTGKWSKSLGKFKASAVAVGAAIGGITLAAGFVVTKLKEQNQQFKDFERFGLKAANTFGTIKVLAMDSGLLLEDYVDVMKDLTIRIGEASREGGEAAKSFDSINFNFRNFINQDPMSQLKGYADAISKVKGETEALAEVDKLLSDAGTKVFESLRDGSSAFDDAADKANRLGTNVSDIDVENVRMANEAMLSVESSLSSLTQELIVSTAPLIIEIADRLNEAIGVGATDPSSETGTFTGAMDFASAGFTSAQDFVMAASIGTQVAFGVPGANEEAAKLREREDFAINPAVKLRNIEQARFLTGDNRNAEQHHRETLRTLEAIKTHTERIATPPRPETSKIPSNLSD